MKTRKKRSKIWEMPFDEFQKLVKSKTSLAQILKHLNYATTSGNYRTLKGRNDYD